MYTKNINPIQKQLVLLTVNLQSTRLSNKILKCWPDSNVISENLLLR